MILFYVGDAKKIMSSYYGFDDKKIGIDVYSFSYEGSQITISVMKEGCVPVGEHITGKAFLLDVGFMGMTSGVKNATVFDIPKPCQRSMPLSFLEHNVGTFNFRVNIYKSFRQKFQIASLLIYMCHKVRI